MQRTHTLESVKAIAINYKTRSEFSAADQGAYASAKRNGWFEECTAHMGGKIQWTFEMCKASAAKYTTRSEWKKEDYNAYAAAHNNGWINDCAKHMLAMKETWTLEKCKASASNYQIPRHWRDAEGSAHNSAKLHGWFDECTVHMDKFEAFTFEECKASAAKFQTRSDWKDGDVKLYRAAFRNKWSELCTEHMGAPNTISSVEGRVFDYVLERCPDAVRSERTILGGKREIDIYIPSLSIGIEYNGLAWHSDRLGKPSTYHQEKTNVASSKGIKLVHIWSDEWLDNEAVVKGYLDNLLQVKPQQVVAARHCELITTTGAEQREFLDNNHLQGFASGNGYALTHKGETVAIALVKNNRNSELELVRLCFKIGVEVIGGFQKLLAQFNQRLVSFCDTDKFDGAGYTRAGWVLVTRSPAPVYYVNKNCNARFNRDNFKRADMIQSLTEAGHTDLAHKTEKELAKLLGFDQLTGCELLKFAWEPK